MTLVTLAASQTSVVGLVLRHDHSDAEGFQGAGRLITNAKDGDTDNQQRCPDVDKIDEPIRAGGVGRHH